MKKSFLPKRRSMLQATLAAGALGVASFAGASSFPNPDKPIKMIVPYAAGGGTDAMARAIGQHLSKKLGTNVIIENKPGAGTQIGTSQVARSPADGYTVLVTTTAFLQAPSIYKNLSFDPVEDFVPVSLLAKVPLAMTVPNDSPAKTVHEFIELAKAEPDVYPLGNYGIGTLSHVQGAMFIQQAEVDVAMIPYNGASPLAAAISGGHVAGGFVDMSSLGLAQGGRIRYLAVAGDERLPYFPEIPTMTEEGFEDFDVFGWAAMFVPAGTPDDIVQKISDAALEGAASPEFTETLEVLAYQPGNASQQEFAEMVKNDIHVWDRLIKTAGIEPQ